MAAASELTRGIRRGRHLDGAGRLAGIDLARGLAVVGMLAAHLTVTAPWAWHRPETWSDVVNGRSSILFALLAGVSIALVTGGPQPVAAAERRRVRVQLALRAGMVWLIGLALIATLVPVYVILPAYALLFLLALPFIGLRAPALFAIAGGLAVVMPLLQPLLSGVPLWDGELGGVLSLLIGWWYPFTTWIVFLLAGMAIGRLDLTSRRTAALLAVVGAAVAAAAYGLDALVGPFDDAYLDAVISAAPHSAGLFEVTGSTGFAAAVLGLCLLVCRTWLRWPAWPLRAVGSMPLTAYAAQIVVWAIVALIVLGDVSDLEAMRGLDLFGEVALGIVAGCTVWALVWGRGPLERLVGWVSHVAAPKAPDDAGRLER